MATYLIRRLLLMIPTLIGITFLVFMLIALAPGGIGAALTVSAGQMQSQKGVAIAKARLEDRYGLDDPAPVQYIRWLGRISPVKIGTRDLIGPSGETIRKPKALKPPPLWEWFTTDFPRPAPALAIDQSAPLEERIEAFKRADRQYADARAAYISSVTIYKQALGEYAKATHIHDGVNPKGEGKPGVLRRDPPAKWSAAWPPLAAAAEKALADYRAALQAREDLVVAFEARPYRRAGYGVGPVSVAAPDLGVTFSTQRPVITLIKTHLPVTLFINLIAFPIIYLVAIPGGMLAATKRGTALDVGLGMLFIALWSFPVVLAGVLAIGFLADNQYLGAFPVSGLHSNDASRMRFLPGGGEPGYIGDTLWHICLPVLCLVYTGFAILSKQCRAAMLDNFSADYVRTAKAKGVAPRDVVFRHVFRNSLLPLITMFVTIFPAMLAGSVVVEKIFTVQGMGTLILKSIADRDRELLLANTFMIATINLLALLLADILYALADPRVAYD